MPACPDCGRENPPGARFCNACGAPLAVAAEEPREMRKTVTILFADVTGSTALGERLDPEAVRRVMGRWFEAARDVLERHGGTVEKFIGDAVMAVFGIPTLHEDDALRAVRAPPSSTRRLAELNAALERDHGVRLAVRTGVNTGEVVAGEGETLATGDAVNVAARLEQAAQPGEILLGRRTTFRLVRDAVDAEPVEPLALKGKAEPVEALPPRSVSARRRRHRAAARRTAGRPRPSSSRSCARRTSGQCGSAARLSSRCSGRPGSASRVSSRSSAARSRARRPCCAAAASRTARGSRSGRSSRCCRTPAGTAPPRGCASFSPANRMPSSSAARLDVALGEGDAGGSTDDAFWAARKLFEHAARSSSARPRVDDMHWAEPTFLDLVDHVADWSRDAPILLLCVARPELLERDRPGPVGS